MRYPPFFNAAPVVALYDPLAEFLGALSAGIIEYRYVDAVRFAGHSCPTVACAFHMTRAGLKALYQPYTRTLCRGVVARELKCARGHRTASRGDRRCGRLHHRRGAGERLQRDRRPLHAPRTVRSIPNPLADSNHADRPRRLAGADVGAPGAIRAELRSLDVGGIRTENVIADDLEE